MSTPNQPGKAMSSRLMQMKFMKRAAASSPSTPSTPVNGPPTKRSRLSDWSSSATPTQQSEVASPIVDEEEVRRLKALERQAALAGETKWVLSYKDTPPCSDDMSLRVVTAGYATIDSAGNSSHAADDDQEDRRHRPNLLGRRSFGKFNRRIEKQQNPDLSSSSSGSASSASDSEDDEEEDDPTGAQALIRQSRKEASEKARAERKAKGKAAKEESLRLAEKRRSRGINQNEISSISNAGASSIICHECGEKGHTKKACPTRQGQQSRRKRYPV
ncbi:hypothetical protein LTR28_003567 [Elasticomyces elasticus]|nr:hypothetical protein LTR28_003567 [Elasticomyces elasticus]